MDHKKLLGDFWSVIWLWQVTVMAFYSFLNFSVWNFEGLTPEVLKEDLIWNDKIVPGSLRHGSIPSRDRSTWQVLCDPLSRRRWPSPWQSRPPPRCTRCPWPRSWWRGQPTGRTGARPHHLVLRDSSLVRFWMAHEWKKNSTKTKIHTSCWRYVNHGLIPGLVVVVLAFMYWRSGWL